MAFGFIAPFGTPCPQDVCTVHYKIQDTRDTSSTKVPARKSRVPHAPSRHVLQPECNAFDSGEQGPRGRSSIFFVSRLSSLADTPSHRTEKAQDTRKRRRWKIDCMRAIVAEPSLAWGLGSAVTVRARSAGVGGVGNFLTGISPWGHGGCMHDDGKIIIIIRDEVAQVVLAGRPDGRYAPHGMSVDGINNAIFTTMLSSLEGKRRQYQDITVCLDDLFRSLSLSLSLLPRSFGDHDPTGATIFSRSGIPTASRGISGLRDH